MPVNDSDAEVLKTKRAVLCLGGWVIYSKTVNLRIPKGYVGETTLAACPSLEEEKPSSIRTLVSKEYGPEFGFVYYMRTEDKNYLWIYDRRKGFGRLDFHPNLIFVPTRG